MTKQEKYLVIGLAVLLGAGVVTMHAHASLGADAFGESIDMTGKLNASMRKSGSDLFSGSLGGTWQVPEHALRAVGSDVLHANHPLHRRPGHSGQNRYKVMTQGWGGWFYNPPAEVYF